MRTTYDAANRLAPADQRCDWDDLGRLAMVWSLGALIAAVVLAGCVARPAYNDYWVDNQWDRPLIVALEFDAGMVVYQYSVPPHARGILLQGFADIADTVTVRTLDGTALGSFARATEEMGVVIDESGKASARPDQRYPFADSVQFELLPES